MGAENPGPSFISEGPIHPIGRTTFPCVDYFSGLLMANTEVFVVLRSSLILMTVSPESAARFRRWAAFAYFVAPNGVK